MDTVIIPQNFVTIVVFVNGVVSVTETNKIEIITDNVKEPYGLYVTLFKSKKDGTLIIKISKEPGIVLSNKEHKPLNYNDIAI